MSNFSYHMHGLTIDSQLELHAPRACSSATADLRIIAACTDNTEQISAGNVVFESLNDDESVWQRVCTSEGRFIVTYMDVAEFVLSPSLDCLHYRWLKADRAGFGRVLLEGYVLALVALLRGSCVLHASAVRLADGRALLLVGSSGSGKSTSAALLAAGGHQFLADDVVAIRIGVGSVTMSSGVSAVRLRRSAWDLADRFVGANIHLSADDRLVLEIGAASAADYEVAAIWFPRPDHQADRVIVDAIDPFAAFVEVMRNQRANLEIDALKKRVFEQVSQLVTRVPLATVVVPWSTTWTGAHIDGFVQAARGLCS